MAKRFTLGKKERLKSRKLIEQLFEAGNNFTVSPFRIYYTIKKRLEAESHLQFGVGVSSRNFKKAVDRNRIKRLTREAYRLQKNQLQDKLKESNLTLIIFFIYTGKELPEFSRLKEKLNVILKKMIKITDENIAANS